MALEVVWSEKAEQQLGEIISYLEMNWSSRACRQFFKRLEEGIDAIKLAPNRYKISFRNKDSREFQLTPHTTIFYTYDEKYIYILLLWANKKDPNNLNLY